MPNFKLVKANLILDEFAQAYLRPSTLASALRDKKKDYLNGLEKAISTIKNYMTNLLHPLLEEKIILKIWSILESCFRHILSMSISAIFLDKCKKKSTEFENIIDYTNCYQAIYNKMTSLI